MTTRPVTQSAGLYPYGRLRARLGLQVKRMLDGRRLRGAKIEQGVEDAKARK